MVRGCDCTTRTVGLTYRPVLLEGRCALDRGRIRTRCFVDVVDTSVGRHCALERKTRRGVVRAEIFGDIVLDEWVRGPSVDGEVAVAVGLVVGIELDGSRGTYLSKDLVYCDPDKYTPSRARVPSFASHEVAIA